MTIRRRALVLGAGPAGLLAAWAAAREGLEVTILDRDVSFRPDRIFSLQYLHEPCDLPSSAIRGLRLRYEHWGGMTTPERARRLYNIKLGRDIDDANSTRFLWDSPVKVWSLRSAYSYLYGVFGDSMIRSNVTWQMIQIDFQRDWELVVNTIPLPVLLPSLSWPVRMMRIAMHYTPVAEHAENTCVYNLNPYVGWFRATNLDGDCATEYITSADRPPLVPEENWCELRKVVAAPYIPPTEENVLLTGRWGSWNPSALTHHAYNDVRMRLKGMVTA